MKKPLYLTKSRFKMATECPTKLFYTSKKEYANTQLDDPFLAALADGGFQVGELSKCYYPTGHDITTLDYDDAQQQTLELLKQNNVIIFEPAIRFNNLFIRIDILIKTGNRFELIEVKAKSYSKKKDNDFLGARGGISSSWKPYLFDVAFQKYVLQGSYPKSIISSYLMLVDKDTTAKTDSLNQKFFIVKDSNNRKGVKVSSNLSKSDLKSNLLIKVNVDAVIEKIYAEELSTGMPAYTFKDNIESLALYYKNDERIVPVIGSKCKSCEFKASTADQELGKLDGFQTCWKEQLRWKDEDFNEQTVLNIWNFRKANDFIEQGIIKIKDISEEDIKVEESVDFALSASERQWMQIDKVKRNDNTVYFDIDTMKSLMNNWTYPLHFIDFETSAVAIPFYKGMRPYEGIAFQFSHHVMYEDGRIEHIGEFLNTEVGTFPNFEFVRELKKQLEVDEGTIFRYSPHENTYLNMIYRQLNNSSETDRDELQLFIKTITNSTKNSKENWQGVRSMVDLWDLVKKYYYDPITKGSNSIKAVLPAILNSSVFLQNKYQQPIYGSKTLPSLNFSDKQWLTKDENGDITDPYKSLPKMFKDSSDHDIELLSEGDELNNGGLALTAYARMQFTQMSEYERKELNQALLKYCELDTLAMVMIVEAWKVWIENS